MDENKGYAGGYNEALKRIEADYFVLLNSDVETPQGWLEPLVELAEGDPAIAALSPKIRSFEQRDRFEYAGAAGGFIDKYGYPFCRGRILSTIEKDCGQYDTTREVFWASGACLLVRATVFRELCGFDAAFFAHMEEIDLCWRAQLKGCKIMVCAESIVYHLGGGTLPNNTPRKIYFNYRNNLSMLYKNLPESDFERVLLFRMLLDGMSAIFFLLQGRFSFVEAVWDAYRDYNRRKGELAGMRAEIQLSATHEPKHIYPRSMLLRYFFGGKTFGRFKM
jgi:GT2 family glycosyltransferase